MDAKPRWQYCGKPATMTLSGHGVTVSVCDECWGVFVAAMDSTRKPKQKPKAEKAKGSE
jgi:hypothetical protein